MKKTEPLETVEINVKNGVYKVNGRDISETGFYFNLTFEDGIWSLMIRENTLYSTSDQRIME